jgi:excisionase family DNA binding protein
MTDRLLTVAELQERLGVARGIAYDLVQPGGPIPAIRFGRAIRVSERQLDAWIANGGRIPDHQAASSEASSAA